MSADPATRGQLYYEDVLDGMMTNNLPEFIGGGPAAAKPLFLEAEKKFSEVQDELAKLKDVQIRAEE